MDGFSIVLVRGSGDVGSAIAHGLYMRGAKVILHDEPAPAHPRRGMAFTDALFDGSATLDGVDARHATDIESLLIIGAIDEKLPVCDAPFEVVLAAYEPDVLVDARMRKRAAIEDQRTLAPTVVGLGPGFDTRINCDIAIETAWGSALGEVVRQGATQPLGGEPRSLGGFGRDRFVYAPVAGCWRTSLRIGAPVAKGQEVGSIDRHRVVAPLSGVLRGLSHDGVTVAEAQKIIEVDARDQAQFAGQGERPRAAARGVLKALHLCPDAQLQFFDFERSFEATLDCMPMSVRFKLDMCDLKLSLAQWRALPADARRTVLDAQCTSSIDVRRLQRFIEYAVAASGGTRPPRTTTGEAAWRDISRVPGQVIDALASGDLPHLSGPAWAALDDLQRFALCKLAARGHTRNLRPAFEEFGLADRAP